MNQSSLHDIFRLGRSNNWMEVLRRVRECPEMALIPIIMGNNLATTIIHQAITSKGNVEHRSNLILTILQNTPQAAAIKNGYGSLPLHVIGQRNTKLDSQSKEHLITELVNAYPGAITEQGGVGKRTPLHILFTDYLSPAITQMMIQKGPMACFVQDRKGYLPIHVACSRHCSPEKLLMLLSVNPDSITARTSDGLTVLDLANRSKTVSHPNQALIEEIERRVVQSQQNPDLFRREMQEGFISLRSISTPVTQSPHTTWTPTTHNMMNNMMLVPPRGSSRVEYHNDLANISDSSDETQAQAQAQPLPVHQRLYPLAPQRTEPHDRYRYDESRQFTPIDRISHGNDIFRKRKVNRGGVSLAYSNYNNDPRCCSSSNHHHDGAHQFSVPITVTPHSSLYTSHSRLRSSEGGASAFTGYRPTRSTTTNLRPVRLFHDDDDDDDSSRPTIHVERDVNESSFVGTVPNNQGQYGYNSIVQARTRSPAAVVAVRRGSRSSFVTTPPPRNRVQQRSSVNGGRRMMMMVENNNNNNMNRSTESSSPAHLLLHFSQNVSSTVTDSPKRKRDIAEV